MPTLSSIASWAVAALGTGGIGKFVYDMVTARQGGKKAKAEGAVLLVDSASTYAQGLVGRLDKITDEFDEYRREQQARDRRQELLFRQHAEWDDEVRRRLRTLGESVEPAPPLWSES